MGLKVVLGGVQDAARSIEIESSAFSEDPLTPALFPGPFPDGNEHRIASRAKMLTDSPYLKMYKVVDEELEAQRKESNIASAIWYVWDQDTVSEETFPSRKDFGPGVNAEAMGVFLGGMKKKLIERYNGKKLVYLKLLSTHSDHQRRGAGALLLQWGSDEADRMGAECYLEATVKGRPLYEKFGYRQVDMFNEDMTRFGGPDDTNICLMARPAATN